MAAPRLPFLWPMLARGIESSSPRCATTCLCQHPARRSARAASRMRAFHTSGRRAAPELSVMQRYGTANEPPPHLSNTKVREAPQAPAEPAKALPKIGEKLQRDGEAERSASLSASQKQETDAAEKTKGFTMVDGASTAPPSSKKTTSRDPILDAAESGATQKPPEGIHVAERHPLESLLHTVPDPATHAEELHESNNKKDPLPRNPEAPPAKATIVSSRQDQRQQSDSQVLTPAISKAPHLDAPRFVHHFDTYSLVRQLETSGWSSSQAITVMKATRLILAENMNLAHDALVSKSQIENETYLFKAACAELKTEVTGRRQGEREQMHTQRVQLQHEAEMLTQRIGQESAALKDELKGMFDDRRMAVRNEQRGMDSKIQRLNYRIAVDLQADGKSEVEGLRWVMTRRVIIALGVVVIMVLGSLKLYSNTLHDRELDAKRRASSAAAASSAQPSGHSRSADNGNGGGDSAADARMLGEMLVKEGDNPAFVSLG